LLGVPDGETLARLSPVRCAPRPGVRVGVVVGGSESEEFKWQSSEIVKSWRTDAFEIISGKNHFSLLDGLNGGTLLDLARDIAARA
jgi:hypothetical protein